MRLVAAACLGVLGIAACDPQRVEEFAVETFRFDATTERPRIEVRIEEGDVEIQGVENLGRIEAEFRKRARSVDRETASGLLPRIEVRALDYEGGARFRFEGRVEAIPPFGGDLRTDLVLRVPSGVELEVATGDGRIRIEGIEGGVRAESGDGRIFVERCRGELRLRTEDGSIVGREIEGKTEATTDDGEIDLEGTFPRLEATTSDGSIEIDAREWPAAMEGWVVRTGDGAIRALLPASATGDIDATVSDGRIVNRLASFDGAAADEGDRRLRGKLGGGGALLLFSSMDGRIELAQK